MSADLIAEKTPAIMASLEASRDAVWELADLLSDAYALHCGEAGLRGVRTPRQALRLYAMADEIARVAERLERALR